MTFSTILGLSCFILLTNIWVSKLPAGDSCINIAPGVITHSAPQVVHTHLYPPSAWRCSGTNKPDVSMSTTCKAVLQIVFFSTLAISSINKPWMYKLTICNDYLHLNMKRMKYNLCANANGASLIVSIHFYSCSLNVLTSTGWGITSHTSIFRVTAVWSVIAKGAINQATFHSSAGHIVHQDRATSLAVESIGVGCCSCSKIQV